LAIASLGASKKLDQSLCPENSEIIQAATATFISPGLQTLPAPGVTS